MGVTKLSSDPVQMDEMELMAVFMSSCSFEGLPSGSQASIAMALCVSFSQSSGTFVLGVVVFFFSEREYCSFNMSSFAITSLTLVQVSMRCGVSPISIMIFPTHLRMTSELHQRNLRSWLA